MTHIVKKSTILLSLVLGVTVLSFFPDKASAFSLFSSSIPPFDANQLLPIFPGLSIGWTPGVIPRLNPPITTDDRKRISIHTSDINGNTTSKLAISVTGLPAQDTVSIAINKEKTYITKADLNGEIKFTMTTHYVIASLTVTDIAGKEVIAWPDR